MGCTVSNPEFDHKLAEISTDREAKVGRFPVEQIDSKTADSRKVSSLPLSERRIDVGQGNTGQTKVDDNSVQADHVTSEAGKKEEERSLTVVCCFNSLCNAIIYAYYSI